MEWEMGPGEVGLGGKQGKRGRRSKEDKRGRGGDDESRGAEEVKSRGEEDK